MIMFNLEQSIAEWREQMLAAGIQTPVPLEELENHLREEIEQQMKSELNESSAFREAVQKVGPPDSLQSEFKKLGGSFIGMLGINKTVRINRALGLLWLIYCVGSFYTVTKGLWSAIHLPDFRLTPLFWIAVVLDLIYFRGLIACVRLIAGVMRERRFILFLAILDAIGGVAFLVGHRFQPLVGFYTLAGFISIWLLWPSRKTRQALE
jgi:hypothetical protein